MWLSIRTYWVAALAGILVIVPTLWGGGRSEKALGVFFLTILLALFLLRRKISPPPPRHPFWVLILFVAWALVHSFLFSSIPITSLRSLLPLAGGALLSIFFLSHSTPGNRMFLAYILVGGSLLLVFVGLIFFVGSQNYGYLRLVSTFFQHNALAGFLILPIVLSFLLLFYEKRFGYILTGTAVLFLLVGFFLTFSRGGFISFAVALAIFSFFLWRGRRSVGNFLLHLFVIVFLVSISWGLALSIFHLKQQQGMRIGEVVAPSPYAAERPGETGFRARLVYMRNAFELWSEKPIHGFGLGSFGEEARRIQREARFFSTDPHNLYLRMLAELGGLGAALLILFIVWVIVMGIRAACGRPPDALMGAYVAGFVGMVIHNGGDVDFQFPANVYLFFLTASLVTFPKREQGVNAGHFSWFAWISILAALLFLLCVLGFITEYFSLETPRRIRALERASLLSGDGNLEDAEIAFQEALLLAPYKNLDPVVGLVGIYLRTDRRSDAKIVIEKALLRFPIEAFESPFWTDPAKERINLQRRFLEKTLRSLDR